MELFWFVYQIFILIAAIYDLKHKAIPVWIISGYGLVFLMECVFLYGSYNPVAFMPGLVLLILAILFKTQIGPADGIGVLYAGVFWSLENMISILLLALVLAMFCGMGIVLIRKKDWNYRLPFIPFWLVAIGIVRLTGGI